MITKGMIQNHLQKSLSEGGVLAKELTIQYLPERQTPYISIPELSFDRPENKGFYSAAYTLLDSETNMIIQHEKQRIGGFNTYPIGYSAERVHIVPRVFSGRYRMGFSNFELSASLLSQEVLIKLNALYTLIRTDVENEVAYNTEDSTLVLHRTQWEPPHFHIQDKTKMDSTFSISYAVKIAGTGPSTSIFDFFSDSFKVCLDDNPISKILFKSQFIHQVYKTSLTDENLYFFFVWDGVKLKKQYDLEKHVYVERWHPR